MTPSHRPPVPVGIGPPSLEAVVAVARHGAPVLLVAGGDIRRAAESVTGPLA